MCDKLSTKVATVRAHPDKYEKNFDAVVPILIQYIDKRAPMLSVKELQQKAGLLKDKKTPASSKALVSRVAILKVKTENSGNESLFPDEKHTANNRNNPALARKGSRTRQSQTDT